MKITYKQYKDKILTANTIGLQKSSNEDIVEFRATNDNALVCLCDGHWGDYAAKLAVNQVIRNQFPKSKKEAVLLLKKIELNLWQRFGQKKMNPKHDFTSETSLIAIKKSKNSVTVMAYGDCRMIISRNGKQIFHLKTTPTWLGAFSYLRLRDRYSIDEAIIYKKIICQPGDVVILFSDGIDECIYNQATISTKWLTKQVQENISLRKIAGNILIAIEQKGAEDNASLALVRI